MAVCMLLGQGCTKKKKAKGDYVIWLQKCSEHFHFSPYTRAHFSTMVKYYGRVSCVMAPNSAEIVCVCVCVCVCECTHVCVCVHVCVHACVHASLCVWDSRQCPY